MHYFNKEKQSKLIKKWREHGDQHALNLLISSNKRLVTSMAIKIRSSNYDIELEDLIQEGYIGMMDAVRKFDPDKGASFSSYACYSIRNRINKFLMSNKSLLKFATSNDGRLLFQKHPVISRKLDKLSLTEEEKCVRISKELSVPIGTVRDFRKNISNGVGSLDRALSGLDSQSTLSDFICSDEDVELDFSNRDFHEAVILRINRMMLDEFTEFERAIVKYRYLSDERLTFSEISKMFGYSVQHASNTERSVLGKIKKRIASDFELENRVE